MIYSFHLLSDILFKPNHSWQTVEETGKLLRLLLRVEGRGGFSLSDKDISCWEIIRKIIDLINLVVCRSFDELEEEMLRGQKLQVR